MFSKRSNNVDTMSSSAPSERTHSVLSHAVTITGQINTKDDLRIDGCVEGNITCEGKVIIGPKGKVKGNIESQSIELMGQITGDIIVYDIVRLKSTSYFKGEITAVNIEIEAGANFYGNCKMSDKQRNELMPEEEVLQAEEA